MPERRIVARRRGTVQTEDPRAALRAWRVDRPAFWAATRFGDLPLQATQFDGLTRLGREVFWSSLERPDFSYANVQLALASDVAAVVRFRQADPRGAQAITAFLDLWLQCLARWDSLAVARARDKNVWGPRSYYQKVRAAQERRAMLEGRLAATETIAAPVVVRDLEQRLRAKLADWRSLLARNVDSGRDVLKALLVGPVRFTPIVDARRRAYMFEGSISLQKLVSGVIELPKALTGVASLLCPTWNEVRAAVLALDDLRKTCESVA